ncbi:Hypothetical protein PBC10988_19970 [Planctomycetales bacterium 10988]|nr:Hypothetical protein PBC10988_19970 [Planctomycetales bacterium 10988]
MSETALTERRGFTRKLVYLGILVLLMLPIAWLSMPASSENGQFDQQSGGKLTQLRHQYQLHQSSLGELDPTSDALRLSLLGMRGVAVNLLWKQAHEFQKKEDWANMMAAIDSIVRLQPHFISVWRFQSWNVSYNVSVEWDDYRDRYHWIMRGISFLKEGIDQNNNHPSLLYDTGWTISQKIGKSDETQFYRSMFKNDPDIHPEERSYEERDNWLVGKEYYNESVAAEEARPGLFSGTSDMVFYSRAPLNNMYYSMALQNDGMTGEIVQQAWDRAYREWSTDEDSYGEEVFHTESGEIRANELERLQSLLAERREELEEMAPGLREEISQQRFDLLPRGDKQILSEKSWLLPKDQRGRARQLRDHLEVSDRTVAMAMPEEKQAKAITLVTEIEDLDARSRMIKTYREIVNFDYWKQRAQAELTDQAMTARHDLYQGQKLAAQADLEPARDSYELGMEYWRLVLDRFPELKKDLITGQEVYDLLADYRDQVLRQLMVPPVRLPKGYGLISILEIKDWQQLAKKLTAGASEESTPAGRLWQTFSEENQALWKELAEGKELSADDQFLLLDEVNDLLQKKDFYQEDRFGEIKPSEEDQKVLNCYNTEEFDPDCQGYTLSDLRQVNRRLLVEAFPESISPAENQFVLYEMMNMHVSLAEVNNFENELDPGIVSPPTSNDEKLPPLPPLSGALSE